MVVSIGRSPFSPRLCARVYGARSPNKQKKQIAAQVEKSYHTWVMEQEANLLQGIEEIQLTDPKQSIAGSLSDVKDDVYTFRTTVQLDRDYVPVTSSIVEDPSEGTSTARALTTRKQAGRGVAGESALASIEGQGVVEPSGTSTPIEPGIGDRNDPLTRILLSWLETAREEILHPPPMDPSSSQLVPTSPFTPERLPENIHDLYHHLPLLPLDEKYPILLSALPEEILENVVEFMDVTTLERFALVCKRLRVLTRGVGKWRSVLLGFVPSRVDVLRSLCETVQDALSSDIPPADFAARVAAVDARQTARDGLSDDLFGRA